MIKPSSDFSVFFGLKNQPPYELGKSRLKESELYVKIRKLNLNFS